MFTKKRKENYSHIETEVNPNSYVSHSIQKLIINLEYSNIDSKYKVIQVTSTLPTEGKTTLMGNLSYVLAQKGYKVLLMDLDLRKPKVNRIFNHANANGLSNFLLGSVKKEELIVQSDKGIDFIVSGSQTSSVGSILESEKLKTLIDELKEDYDYILLDTPPIQVNSDALLITRLSDGVIYVIGDNIVKKHYIKDAIDSLRRHGVEIIGIALTQVKIPKRRSYYYYEND